MVIEYIQRNGNFWVLEFQSFPVHSPRAGEQTQGLVCVSLCFGAASPVGVLACPGGSDRLMDYVYGSGLMVSAVEALTLTGVFLLLWVF